MPENANPENHEIKVQAAEEGQSASTGEPTGRVHLSIRAADSATEIFLINGEFSRVARGVGRLEAELKPGIYKIKSRAGSQTREEFISLPTGSAPVVKELPPFQFIAAVPLADTTKTHEYQMVAATSQCSKVRHQAGHGSWIYVFARDWTPPDQPRKASSAPLHPARGLTLRTLDDRVIADFGIDSESDLTADPWAASNVEVDPGIYVLSLEMRTEERLQQTVVACPGWQTQVFLLQQAYGDTLEDRRADIGRGSVLMSRDERFDPTRPDYRLAEMARLGLSNQRKVASDEIRQMLAEKIERPMLGIYAGHLLLLDENPPLDLLRHVVETLRGLIGAHPDVEALSLALDSRETTYVFAAPPMLRRSWSLVVKATATRPELVPLDSLASRSADRLSDADPWLQWLTMPDQPSTRKGRKKAAVATNHVEVALEEQLQVLQQQRDASPGPGGSGAAPRGVLGDIGASVLSAPEEKPVPSGVPADEDTVQKLTERLGVPRANVEAMLTKLASRPEAEESK